MAFFRIEVLTKSRSIHKSGKTANAVSSAAYRHRAKMTATDYFNKNEVKYDYSKKNDYLTSFFAIPEHAHGFFNAILTKTMAHEETRSERVLNAKIAESLWQEVEKSEKRKDSRLYREFLISLPRELSDEDNIEAVKKFTQNLADKEGILCDVVLHKPNASDGEANLHAHIMTTTRVLNNNGTFGAKIRALDGVQQNKLTNSKVEEWRLDWENVLKNALEARNIPSLGVSSLSYEKQLYASLSYPRTAQNELLVEELKLKIENQRDQRKLLCELETQQTNDLLRQRINELKQEQYAIEEQMIYITEHNITSGLVLDYEKKRVRKMSADKLINHYENSIDKIKYRIGKIQQTIQNPKPVAKSSFKNATFRRFYPKITLQRIGAKKLITMLIEDVKEKIDAEYERTAELAKQLATNLAFAQARITQNIKRTITTKRNYAKRIFNIHNRPNPTNAQFSSGTGILSESDRGPITNIEDLRRYIDTLEQYPTAKPKPQPNNVQYATKKFTPTGTRKI